MAKFTAICRLIVDFYWTGKTELAKQVARYLHKDNMKVNATVTYRLVQSCWFEHGDHLYCYFYL